MYKKEKIIGSITGLAAAGILLSGVTAFAQTADAQPGIRAGFRSGSFGTPGMQERRPGIFGTVSAVNGTTLTVTGKEGPQESGSGAAYTVDASGATVHKEGEVSSLSAIAVGDTVMIEGTVSGTNVTASLIRDGARPRDGSGRGPEGGAGKGAMASFEGNGQPVVAGTVSSVSGATFALATKSGISYTVDASAAAIMKAGATSTLAALAGGDAVVVQGAVTGTAVTASTVIDHGAPPAEAAGGTSEDGALRGPRGGFFARIGGFFGGFLHLFGF